MGLGIVGAWCCRILDESRNRPAFVIESVIEAAVDNAVQSELKVISFPGQRDAA